MATVDLGKISFTQKGNYDNSTSYAPKDVVQHTDQNETSSFVKINSTATGQVPQTNGTINSSHWAIFAKGTSLATPNQGAYDASTTYSKGAVVQHTDSGVTSTFLYINNTPASGQTPSTSGTVNTSHWQLIAKGTDAVGLTLQSVHTGATLSALAGNIYPIDTTSNAVTATLPASPSAGDQIMFIDYASNFATNKLTIDSGSVNFEGQNTNDGTANLGKQVIHLIYINSTKGWLPIQSTAEQNITLPPRGQSAYTTAGSFVFTVPTGVTSLSVVCVGAGGGNSNGNSGGAGGGGALAYRNNITVTPGSTASIVVGAGKSQGGGAGGSSSFTYSGTTTTAGGGGAGTTSAPSASGGAGGTASGTTTAGFSGGAGGGDSNNHGGPGGGGAAGYSGNGGAGASKTSQPAVNGSAGSGGGAGGGGSGGTTEGGGGGGGGVGLLGEGSSGAGGQGYGGSVITAGDGGGGGSGGDPGSTGQTGAPGNSSGGPGGNYGGGAGGPQGGGTQGVSAGGAVRVIYGTTDAGTPRAFPSTGTGDLSTI